MKQWIVLIFSLALFLTSADTVSAQQEKEPITGHVFYGKMIVPNNDPQLEGGDFDITVFGLDFQKSFSPKSFKYGIEVGGLFSLDSDLRQVSASSGSDGGKASVSVDINSFLVDVFFGGYVGYQPAKWIQLNLGAGPLIIWAKRESDPVAAPADEFSSESESGVGAGLYARVGLDIFFTEYFGLNAGARISETTLSLENKYGKVDIEGYQYYIGLAFRF